MVILLLMQHILQWKMYPQQPGIKIRNLSLKLLDKDASNEMIFFIPSIVSKIRIKIIHIISSRISRKTSKGGTVYQPVFLGLFIS